MTLQRALVAAGVLLCVKASLRAQTDDLTFGEPPFAQSEYEMAGPITRLPVLPNEQPADGTEWCESPYRTTAWGFESGFTLTTFQLTDGRVRYWNNDALFVQRLGVEFENPHGHGVRVQFWMLEEEFRGWAGPLETRVATTYLDGYQRLFFGDAELLIGGGLAYGNLRIASPFFDETSRFSGLGGSLLGEGFYPFLRFKKADLGIVGRARMALLVPLDDDIGKDKAVIIDELGSGIELRRRFGRQQDKWWYLRLAREFHHWTDADWPLSTDQSLQSTDVRMGLAW